MTLLTTSRIAFITLVCLLGGLLVPAVSFAQDTIQIGDQVRINTTANDTLNIRSSPGIDAYIIERATDGTLVWVIDGPQQADGYTWWLVRTPRNNEGWAVASADGIQTLVPTGVTSSSDATADSTNETGDTAQALATPVIDWLLLQQQRDGGWTDGYSEASSASITAELVFAFSALGLDVHQLSSAGGNTPVDFLIDYVRTNPDMPRSDMARIMLAVIAIGGNPRDFAGMNLYEEVYYEFSTPEDYIIYVLSTNEKVLLGV